MAQIQYVVTEQEYKKFMQFAEQEKIIKKLEKELRLANQRADIEIEAGISKYKSKYEVAERWRNDTLKFYGGMICPVCHFTFGKHKVTSVKNRNGTDLYWMAEGSKIRCMTLTGYGTGIGYKTAVPFHINRMVRVKELTDENKKLKQKLQDLIKV